MAIRQGHPTVYDLSEGSTEYRYVRGKGVVLFANHGGELYSLRLQKSPQPKSIDKLAGRSLAQGETTLISSSITSNTNVSGSYVATVTGGTGVDSTGSTTGEDIDHILSINLNELTTETAIVDADFIAMYDTDGSHSAKITFENLEDAIFDSVSGDITITEAGVAAIGSGVIVNADVNNSASIAVSKLALTAGDGLTLNTNDMDLDAALTTVTSIYNTSLKIGRASDDDWIDFNTDDAIKIGVDNTERLRIDTLGVDVTGNLTISDGGTIGTATDADAITIAAAGAVTFSQRDVHSSGITIADGGQIGSASDLDSISIASGGDVTFSQDIKLGTYSSPNFSNGLIGSSNFNSGYTGGGWQVNHSSNNFTIELDNMFLRGTLSVYELLIQQIRATNGAVFVTSAAKVEATSGLSSSDDDGTITFEDPSGADICPFLANDIIMMQRIVPGALVDGGAAGGDSNVIKKLVYKVSSVDDNTATVTNISYDNTTAPEVGDEFVRIGNTTNSDRKGLIYLTSDDSNAPFMDVKDGVDSYADWHSTSTTKVRVGKLSGITDAGLNAGSALSGYGLYGGNVFLKGAINATSGHIGANASGENGWLIAESKISNNPGNTAYLSLDGTGDYLSLGQTTSDSPMSITDNITICGWVRFPSLGSVEPIFINNSRDSTYSGIYLYKDSINRLSILWGDGSGTATTDYERVFTTSAAFSANTWTFISIRTNLTASSTSSSNHSLQTGTGSTLSSSLSLAEGGTSNQNSATYGTGEAFIGAETIGTDDINNRIDIKNLALWNEILTDNEITALFNSGDYLTFGTNSGNYTSSANLKLHLDFTTGSIKDLTNNTPTYLVGDAKIVGDGKHIGLVQSSNSSLSNSMSGFYAGADASTGANSAISFGTDGKIRGNGIYVKDNIEYLITASRIFGNGSDGPGYLSGSSNTLSSDKYYTTLTLAANTTIDARGYRIFVRDTLLLLGSSILIKNNGFKGRDGANAPVDGGGASAASNNASSFTDGTGAGARAGSLLGGIVGSNGGAGGAGGDQTAGSSGGAGLAGSSATVSSNCVRVYTTNNGAVGGLGAAGSGGSGSASTTNGSASSEGSISITNSDLTYIIAMKDMFTTATSIPSLTPASGAIGGGGGSGGGHAGTSYPLGGGGGSGGCAGGSGGHLMLVAREIQGTLSNLTLQAKGGAGGDGGNGRVTGDNAGNGGVGAGGNGGDGGCIVLITGTDPSSIVKDVSGGAGGSNGSTGVTTSVGSPATGVTGTEIICHV